MNTGSDPVTTPDATTDVLHEVTRRRILPVVVLDRQSDARPLAQALLAADLPVAEVTFRTPAAAACLAAMAAVGSMTVGAGTIIRPDQVDAAAAAGARFLVSPGYSAAVAHRARQLDIPLVCGVATATELMQVMNTGASIVKFFPAETSGGAAALRALTGPFPDARFIPTGGIGPDNLADYLALPSVLAVGGSWIVAPALIRDRQFDTISRLTADSVARCAAVAGLS